MRGGGFVHLSGPCTIPYTQRLEYKKEWGAEKGDGIRMTNGSTCFARSYLVHDHLFFSFRSSLSLMGFFALQQWCCHPMGPQSRRQWSVKGPLQSQSSASVFSHSRPLTSIGANGNDVSQPVNTTHIHHRPCVNCSIALVGRCRPTFHTRGRHEYRSLETATP